MVATTPRDKNKTKQSYETPDNFFEAVNRSLPFAWDLAASEYNRKCHNFIDESSDSLTHPWHTLNHRSWLWLNPPFKNIAPWARKCYEESRLGANVVMLTPASVGSNWFRDRVWKKALVVFLNGRLTFKGETTCYPKDCMISIFSNSVSPGCTIWDWRNKKPLYHKPLVVGK